MVFLFHSLKRNRLGSDGVAALVAGVTRNAAPKLKKISYVFQRFTGRATTRPALTSRKRPRAVRVDGPRRLHDVGMGTEGLTALTSLLPRRVITELKCAAGN